MKKITVFISFLILLVNSILGQSSVRGKITDENGEPATGVSVYLKSQPSIGSISDFNGQFSLKVPSSGKHIIVISFISYKTIEDTINIKTNEILVKNYDLVSVSKALQDVVVYGKANKSREPYMEKVQAKSITSLNYISSEMIKKIGDTNVSSAVSRISGVSTNGSFISVRGIGDRYMKTAVNGSRIPTLDPFTNNIKLDIFPSSLVDNIVLVKTASADLPGDWAGAYLSIETKDYPEKLSINIETSLGYNPQTSFKRIVSSKKSKTDWLGFDNGLRDINHSEFVKVYPGDESTTFQQYNAIGLDGYYGSLGVTNQNWIYNQEDYTKLGLMQLGLLGASQFEDTKAFQEAAENYRINLKGRAINLLNQPGIESQNKLFGFDWYPETFNAPLSYSQSISIGNQTTILGKSLGFILGFRLYQSVQSTPSSIGYKYSREYNDEFKNNWIFLRDSLNQSFSKVTNGWSALLNLSLKLNNNNSISVLCLPNFIGANSAREGISRSAEYYLSPLDNEDLPINGQFYEARKQMVYQLKTEHYLPKPKMKIELNASYTDAYSNVPNFRRLTASFEGNSSYRYFRYLSEKLHDSRLSAELPLAKLSEAGPLKLKFGGAYQYNKRKTDNYQYGLFAYSIEMLEAIKTKIDSQMTHYYRRLDNPLEDHNYGISEISAGYTMLDYPISNHIRFSGGIRAEKTHLFTDNGYIKASQLDQLDYLPSANLILKLNKKELNPMNLRLSYSKTIARPSIREISPQKVYEYELRSNVSGNQDLKIIEIKNFDLRFEAFLKTGDNFSISAFYKDFNNHIEWINFGEGVTDTGIQWIQSPMKAWLQGLEFEVKKVITEQLDARLNVTWVKSQAITPRVHEDQGGTFGDTITRTMVGQAPYVVNGIINYVSSDRLGLTATLSYNLQGPRLIYLGYDEYKPEVYEMERHLLDLRVSKNVGKHFSVNLKIQDILNTSIRRSYYFDNRFHNSGYLLDFDNFSWGTNYVFSVSYRL